MLAVLAQSPSTAATPSRLASAPAAAVAVSFVENVLESFRVFDSVPFVCHTGLVENKTRLGELRAPYEIVTPRTWLLATAVYWWRRRTSNLGRSAAIFPQWQQRVFDVTRLHAALWEAPFAAIELICVFLSGEAEPVVGVRGDIFVKTAGDLVLSDAEQFRRVVDNPERLYEIADAAHAPPKVTSGPQRRGPRHLYSSGRSTDCWRALSRR